MITHVVFIKFNSDTTEEQVQKLSYGLGDLPSIIDEIKEFRFGSDVIRSERSYDFGLVSSFEDIDALQRYQVHPEHQKVVAHIKAISSSVVAVDFEN